AQLLKEPVGSTRKLHLSTPLLQLGSETEDSGSLEAHDLNGEVKVTRMSRDLLVQGDVEAQVTLICSRCLDEFTLAVDASLEEQYQPAIDVEHGRPIQRADLST